MRARFNGPVFLSAILSGRTYCMLIHREIITHHSEWTSITLLSGDCAGNDELKQGKLPRPKGWLYYTRWLCWPYECLVYSRTIPLQVARLRCLPLFIYSSLD